MHVNQRDIVEVAFPFPNDEPLVHPMIVLSNEIVHGMEECFIGVMLSTSPYYDDEFSFYLTNEMLTIPAAANAQARCHLIAYIGEHEVIKKRGSIRIDSFEELLEKINTNVFHEPPAEAV